MAFGYEASLGNGYGNVPETKTKTVTVTETGLVTVADLPQTIAALP